MDPLGLEQKYGPGQEIAGRYRVVKVLGVGGMGVVLAAQHVELDTLVAIKMLRPEVLANADVVARFAAEARAAVKIKSEHVARVTDVSTLPDGAPYMVMEYLEGLDLSALVEKRGPLPHEEAVDYVLQACEAIAEAHSLGIVHRDLKPGNLFLSRRADGSELVKVLDFGISKTLDAKAAGSLTSTAAILGSPMYMSPEQLSSSKTVDRRTDIWSLGVILFQILTTQIPFHADTLPELFFAIVQNEPPPLDSVRPDLPAGLAAVVARCLEKDRTKRFDSVAELAVALSAFAPQRSRLSVERVLRLAPQTPVSGPASVAGGQSASAGPPVLVHTATSFGQPGRRPNPLGGVHETQETFGLTDPSTLRPRRSRALLVAAFALGVPVALAAWFGRGLLKSEAPAGASASVAAAAPAPPVPKAPAPAVTPEADPAPETTLTFDGPAAQPQPQPEPTPETLAEPAATFPRVRRPARRKPTEAASAEARPTPSAPSAQPAAPAPHATTPAATPSIDKASEWEEDRR